MGKNFQKYTVFSLNFLKVTTPIAFFPPNIYH